MSTDDAAIEAWIEEQSAHADQEVLAEVGSFVIGFSEMISALEEESLLAIGAFATREEAESSPRFPLLKAALFRGDANAAWEIFFGVMSELGRDHWSDEDWKVVKDIRKKVKGAIETRNRFFHDSWRLGGEDMWQLSSWGTYSSGKAAKRKVSRSKSGVYEELKEYDAELIHSELVKPLLTLTYEIHLLGRSARSLSIGAYAPRPSKIFPTS